MNLRYELCIEADLIEMHSHICPWCRGRWACFCPACASMIEETCTRCRVRDTQGDQNRQIPRPEGRGI